MNLDEVILPLLSRTDQMQVLPYDDSDGSLKHQHARIGLIGADEFLELFDKLQWHQDYGGVIDPLRAFIATATTNGRIQDWAIVWPHPKDPGRQLTFDELDVPAPIFRRARRQQPRIDFTGENKRNILASQQVASGSALPGIGGSDTRGILMVSLVADLAVTSMDAPSLEMTWSG